MKLPAFLRSPDNDGGSGAPAPASAPAPAAASPAPAASPTPAPASTPAPAASPTPSPAANTEFVIPDAYKDKPWAEKIKSADDAWKQLENLQTLVGKKAVAPDFAKATPQEIEEYYAQTRPKDITAYEFGKDADPGLRDALGNAMLKSGISAHQANAVIKEFQAAEAQHFTEAGMSKAMEASFGAEWKQTVGKIQNVINANVSKDDRAALDKLPNPDLALVNRVLNNVIKAYGIDEKGGAHTGGSPGAPQGQDLDKVRTDLRSQLDSLSRRPHTADDKQALIDKLNATYEKK